MSNILYTYMNQRFREEEKKPTGEKSSGGPVLTLSREYGCATREVIDHLEKLLNPQEKSSKKAKNWEVITKEILYESSNELDMQPEKLEYVFKSEKRTVMDEILAALSSRYYKSDKRIRNTIREVIRSLAQQGHVIIVGRGGVAITQDLPETLHVRLQAPLYWRAHRISEHENLTFEEAENRAKEMDTKRNALIDEFFKQPSDSSIFDVILNTSTMSSKQIAETIVHVMKLRSLIRP